MKVDPNELQTLYRARFGPASAHRQRVWGVLNQDFFQAMVPMQGTILDLGCGWGEFINTIQAGERLAMDLNPDAAQHLNPDVRLIAQDCSSPWPLQDDTLDVVFTSNFLEHLATKDHLTATLKEALRCIKPGGLLICLGPNIRYLPGAYWDFFDHHIPLSERSLGECVQAAGFEVQRSIPRFLPFTMSNGKPASSWVIRLYLKLWFVWPWFGKQFLVVARKPNVTGQQ